MPEAEVYGMVVVDGMACCKNSELGQEGVEVGTKECISSVCTPIVGSWS